MSNEVTPTPTSSRDTTAGIAPQEPSPSELKTTTNTHNNVDVPKELKSRRSKKIVPAAESPKDQKADKEPEVAQSVPSSKVAQEDVPSVDSISPGKPQNKEESSKRRKACKELGIHLPVARIRHAMAKTIINSSIISAIKALNKDDVDYKKKEEALRHAKTRFSERAFVALSVLAKKTIEHLILGGFDATLEDNHKTVGIDYLYTGDFESSVYHNVLFRLPAYREQAVAALRKRFDAATEASASAAVKDLKSKFTLTAKVKKSAKGDEEKSNDEEQTETPTKPTADKKQFEYYIYKYCIALKERDEKYASLHASKAVLKHISDIVRQYIALVARSAHELTFVMKNKTVNDDLVLVAVKLFMVEPTPIKETIVFTGGIADRKNVDDSFTTELIRSTTEIVDKYVQYIPTSAPKPKKDKKSTNINTDPAAQSDPAAQPAQPKNDSRSEEARI